MGSSNLQSNSTSASTPLCFNWLQHGEYDCCVYSQTFDDGHIIILMLYMNDMLIAYRDLQKNVE